MGLVFQKLINVRLIETYSKNLGRQIFVCHFCIKNILKKGADDTILGGSIHAVKKKTEAVAIAIEETGLEATDEKTEHMIMSGHQHVKKIKRNPCNKLFERVEHFMHLETTLTNRSSVL